MARTRRTTRHRCPDFLPGRRVLMTSAQDAPLLCPVCRRVWILKDPKEQGQERRASLD